MLFEIQECIVTRGSHSKNHTHFSFIFSFPKMRAPRDGKTGSHTQFYQQEAQVSLRQKGASPRTNPLALKLRRLRNITIPTSPSSKFWNRILANSEQICAKQDILKRSPSLNFSKLALTHEKSVQNFEHITHKI